MEFIRLFFGKEIGEDITVEDILRFINEKHEESIHLEYKAIPDTKDVDFRKVAQEVSAFLNSDGGLLFLGIAEQKVGRTKVFPSSITWSPASLTKERMERHLKNHIQPWHNDIRIVPVRNPTNPESCILLIDVPKSTMGPHMTSFRFYYRSNFEITPMNYYQVAEQFNQNWMQRARFVSSIYGPLYNDLNRFLSRKWRLSKCGVQRYVNIISNSRYLLDAVEQNIHNQIVTFFETLLRFNNNVSAAQRRVNAIVTKTLSELFDLDDPKINVYIDADWGNVRPTLNQLLIFDVTPEQYAQTEHPDWRVNHISYELEDQLHPGSKQNLSQKKFMTAFSMCKEDVEHDDLIKMMRDKECLMDELAPKLLQELKQLIAD